MSPAPHHPRSILEASFSQLSLELNLLLADQGRRHEALAIISRCADEVAASSFRHLAPHEAERLLDETIRVLSETESLLRLGNQTSSFRDQYRVLQTRIAELGKQLGYW